MKFHVEFRANQVLPVWYENEDMRVCVGEISHDCNQREWRFHHGGVASNLKTDTLAKLRIWAAEQTTILNLTARLLK